MSGSSETVSTANSAFSEVVAGIRSQDVAREIALKGPFTLGPASTLDGYAVDAIHGMLDVQGSKPAHAILYVRSSGRPFPATTSWRSWGAAAWAWSTGRARSD